MSDVALPKLNWAVVFNRANPPGWKGWGRVRAAQVTEMARSVKVAAIGQSLSAILLVFVTVDSVGPGKLAAWLLALSLILMLSARELRQWQGREIHSVSRKAVDRAAYYSVGYAAIWAAPAAHFFNYASDGQRLAICIVTTSLMAGAAFIFAAVPPAAAAFVFTVGGAVTVMLAGEGTPMITLIGGLYMVGLLVIIYSGGADFMRRRCIELALEDRTETVSMLLRDYESSDADWLWQTNRNLAFQNVSSRFARALGYSAEDLQGSAIHELFERARKTDPASATPIDAVLAKLEKRKHFANLLIPVPSAEGTRCIELSGRPRFNSQGTFIGYRGVGSDVTAARAAADRIAHMARHDALTGLPNRLHLLETLGEALERARQGRVSCAVLLIDLDRFKAVNDSLGHVAGDHLLRQVSSRFEPLLGEGMIVGRLGGDEFALVVPDVTETASLERLCALLIEALKQPFTYNDQRMFVGASIGIALGPGDGQSVEELIRNADLALYKAKGEGGNDWCFYEPGLHANAEERRQLELAMRTALEGGEFSLVYQPVIDAETSEVMSFEALLRWSSPELGDVPPMKFIPIAEETGLIGRIGEWVLRTACDEATRWPASISIAVNISPLQLQEPTFMLTLISALSASGLDPKRLELEVTETVFLQITPPTQKVLQQIHTLGVRLAIDDFGTGYSSLGYLRDSDFDTIKIDKSFVQAISREDPESGAIIRAVVALAESLGMTTVAEGVETVDQLELVRLLGCDRIQGYIFSDPLPGSSVKSLLGEGGSRAAA